MVRIANKELPENKNVWVALSHIHGFGKKFGPTSPSRRILTELNINPLVKVRDLTPEQVNQISQKAKEIPTEGELKEQVQKNISEQISLGTYQGLRRSRKPNPLPIHENKQVIPMIAEEMVIEQQQQQAEGSRDSLEPSKEKLFDLGEFEFLGKEHEGDVGLKIRVRKIKNSSFVEEFEVLRGEINTIKIEKQETGISDINVSVGGKFTIE
ncbi:34938_t:CDS:2, partial [Racocetra persica]